MIRQSIFLTDLILSVVALIMHFHNAQQPQLESVAAFQQNQPTGIAISSAGRMFVNFPLWSDQHEFSVVEVMPDGSTKPYPDAEWNSWNEQSQNVPANKAFVCVQSVRVDDKDNLWILDPASPRMQGVIPDAAKLVKVNLSSNKVEKVIMFNSDVAPHDSYLNDVRIDTTRHYAYITDSGTGAIIAVNLENNQARRLLADHPSTKAEPDLTMTVQGKALKDEHGQTPKLNADGIALSADGDQLYYHALTGKTLYRVPTEVLRNENATADDVGKAVQKVAQTVVTDGLLMDKAGNIYHTAIEQNAIVRFTPEQKLETIIQNQQINWPDSMAFGKNSSDSGELYFTTSQIENMPRFNNGKSARSEPYHIFKVKIAGAEQHVMR